MCWYVWVGSEYVVEIGATLSCGSVVVRHWGHVVTEIGSLGGARHTSVSVFISLSVHGSTSVFGLNRSLVWAYLSLVNARSPSCPPSWSCVRGVYMCASYVC